MYYYCIVSNSAGPTNSTFAYVTLVPVAPAITNEPSSSGALFGGSATLSAGVTGNFRHRHRSAALSVDLERNQPPSTVGHILRFQAANTHHQLQAQVTNTGVYVLNITNDAGFTNTQPVTLTVILAPPASYISYSNLASVYTQNFDSLPNPGSASVNSANPAHDQQWSHSIRSPRRSTLPFPGWFRRGQVGGLGIPQMAGCSTGLAASRARHHRRLTLPPARPTAIKPRAATSASARMARPARIARWVLLGHLRRVIHRFRRLSS